jgi:hypothetical protein
LNHVSYWWFRASSNIGPYWRRWWDEHGSKRTNTSYNATKGKGIRIMQETLPIRTNSRSPPSRRNRSTSRRLLPKCRLKDRKTPWSWELGKNICLFYLERKIQFGKRIRKDYHFSWINKKEAQ